MRLIIFLVVLAAIVGVFVAPPYTYTQEEEARLKGDPFVATHVLAGPIRAWRNWRTCGTVGTCQELRCAALEGGCAPPPPLPWPLNQRIPPRYAGETDAAFGARITAWCADIHSDYEMWSRYLEAGERCYLESTMRPPSGGPSDLPSMILSPKCTPVNADTATAGIMSPTVGELIDSYERHCG